MGVEAQRGRVGRGKATEGFKSIKIILKWIPECMTSLWGEAKVGEMCSYLRVPVKRRAAAF